MKLLENKNEKNSKQEELGGMLRMSRNQLHNGPQGAYYALSRFQSFVTGRKHTMPNLDR